MSDQKSGNELSKSDFQQETTGTAGAVGSIPASPSEEGAGQAERARDSIGAAPPSVTQPVREDWYVINFDGWNIGTPDGVITLDVSEYDARRIVDRHNAALRTRPDYEKGVQLGYEDSTHEVEFWMAHYKHIPEIYRALELACIGIVRRSRERTRQATQLNCPLHGKPGCACG